MRWIRRIALAFGITVVAVSLLLYAVFLFISRPETIPNRPPPADYSKYALADKVGWYEFGPGDARLLTFAPDAPLQLVKFGETTGSSRLTPRGDGAFDWDRSESEPPMRVEFTADEDGSITAITWQDPSGETKSAKRLPDFAYSVRELKYASGDTPLVGTLFLPRGQGPFPAAVMIHGSGNSDRGNRWYMTLAHRLASDGVAVLLPDKRGCGASGGEWRTTGLDTFADDVVAAIKEVRRQSEIDAARVGLLGISQGGWIAPIAAVKQPDVAFVVDLCGANVPAIEQLEHETYGTLGQDGVPAWLQPALVPVAMAIPQRRRPVWWELNANFDPMTYWKQVEQPSLVVYGEQDEQDNVPVAESVSRLRTLDEASHDMTIQVYPDSGHGLYRPGTRIVRHDFLDLLSTWIRAKSEPDTEESDDAQRQP